MAERERQRYKTDREKGRGIDGQADRESETNTYRDKHRKHQTCHQDERVRHNILYRQRKTKTQDSKGGERERNRQAGLRY